MTTDTTSLSPRPLSPRHERFVLEFLKDGNATQAYIRAGYSARGAQPSASKLLRRPQIEAAVAAGRQRIAQALEVDVQRISREYAKIAFASVDDFVSADADGRLRIDLTKAGQAQRAGIVEIRIGNHRNQEQTVTLKPGKLQALAMLVKQIGVLVEKPAPGLTPEDRQRYQERCAGYERALDHREREQRRVEQELREARAALDGARPPGIENPSPSTVPLSHQPEVAEAVGRVVPPTAEPDPTPGLDPAEMFVWSSGREPRLELEPDPPDAWWSSKPDEFAAFQYSEQCEDSTKALESWIRSA